MWEFGSVFTCWGFFLIWDSGSSVFQPCFRAATITLLLSASQSDVAYSMPNWAYTCWFLLLDWTGRNRFKWVKLSFDLSMALIFQPNELSVLLSSFTSHLQRGHLFLPRISFLPRRSSLALNMSRMFLPLLPAASLEKPGLGTQDLAHAHGQAAWSSWWNLFMQSKLHNNIMSMKWIFQAVFTGSYSKGRCHGGFAGGVFYFCWLGE